MGESDQEDIMAANSEVPSIDTWAQPAMASLPEDVMRLFLRDDARRAYNFP